MENVKAMAKFVSMADYMYGKSVTSAKRDDETHDQFEARAWREKVHVSPQTKQLFIPPFALKNALESAGKWLSLKVQGEGKKTYTDRLRKGTLVIDPIWLFSHDDKPLTIDDIDPKRLYVPSDGKRGSAKRVWRIFPSLSEWQGTATIYSLDNKITEPILLKHLSCIGAFIGFGSMRVENGGVNGRFSVEEFAWNVEVDEKEFAVA